MKRALTVLCAIVMLAACSDAPGEAAFQDANGRLTNNQNQFAFGNGPVAQQLAESFNLRLKLMLKLGFKRTSGPGGAKVDDAVITHVQLSDDKVIFLVYVPALRGFNEDAQGTLLDVAWTLARGRLDSLEPARDRQLAVGLRGVLLYGAAAFGPASAEQPATKTNSTGGFDLDDFFPFFVGGYPQDTELTDEEEQEPDTAAAATPGNAAATTTEVVESNDRIASYVGLLATDPPTTAIAIAPDLFVAAEPTAGREVSLRLMRGPAITVDRVATSSDLGLFRPVQSFKVAAITLAPDLPQPGTAVSTYFARLNGDVVEIHKFSSNVVSVDQQIHTDQRLDDIPQGGALVDAEGRLIGIATSSANVYDTVRGVENALRAPRKSKGQ